MKRLALLFGIIAQLLSAQTPSGETILMRVDENQTSENKIIVARMVIHGRRGSRTLESKSWIRGVEESFTEYLSPPREKGTKMLKLTDQLWIYSPSTDRTILISGHMLRQSVMGSDLSYEDMMEDPKLQNLYEASVVGEDSYSDRQCWILQLTAKTPDVTYHTQRIWVDQSRYLILKEDLFAKSGKLLKTTEIKEVFQLDGRWVPKRIVFKDALKSGEGTEFILDTITFNAEIPDYIFTKAALRR